MARERTISFPFRMQEGSLVSTTDYQKIWQDRVLSAVGTAIGERPMDRVDYGTTLAKTLWANFDDVAEIASEQVPVAFSKHLTYLDLAGVDVYETYDDMLDLSSLEVDITYTLPNGDDVTSRAVVGSIEATGEINAYESYDVPAYPYPSNEDDIEDD
jgi:hypothetical protein